MTDLAGLFRSLVDEIEAVHGEAGSKVTVPAGRTRALSAVWFLDGQNHGVRVEGSPEGGVGPRVEAWGRTGDVGFVTLIPAALDNGGRGWGGQRVMTLWLLELAAATVGLLPLEIVARAQ